MNVCQVQYFVALFILINLETIINKKKECIDKLLIIKFDNVKKILL